MAIALVGLATFGLFFAALAAIWFRGKSVPGTRICSRCEFDVRDRGPNQPICPECGADLARPRGMRPQRRRSVRRGSVAAVIAAIALLGCVTPIAMNLASPARRPLWWLQFELRSTDANARSRASVELIRRAGVGSLTVADYKSLAPTLLALQADSTIPWDSAWGRLFETGAARGAMSNAQLQTYLQQGSSFVIRHPKYVAPGGRLHVRYGCEFRRMDNLSFTGTALVPANEWFDAGPNRAFNSEKVEQGALSIPLSGAAGGGGAYGFSHLAKAPLGTHDVVIPVSMTLNTPGWPTTTFTITTRSRLTVTDAPGPFAKAVANPVPNETLTAAFVFEHRRGVSSGGAGADKGIALTAGFSPRSQVEPIFISMLGCKPLTQPVAFEILLRPAGDDNAPWTKLCAYTRRDGSLSTRHGQSLMETVAPPAFWTINAVDVLFRASGEVADEAAMDEYWPGEFMLRDVPLDRKPLLQANGLTMDNWMATPPINPFAQQLQLLASANNTQRDPLAVSRQIDALLDRQGSNGPWSIGDGDLIDELRRRGLVTDEQHARYARQIVSQLTLNIRPRIRLDEKGSFFINGSMPIYRCGVSTDLTVVWDATHVTLNDAVLTTVLTNDAKPRARYLPTADFSNMSPTMYIRPFQTTTSLPPGDYTLRLVQPYRVFAGKVSLEAAETLTPLFAGQQDAEMPVRLLNADEPVIEIIDDNAMVALLEASLTCTSVWANYSTVIENTQHDYGGVMLRAGDLPLAVAFDVFVRPQGDTDPASRWYLGQVVLGPGSANAQYSGNNMPHRKLALANALPEAARIALRDKRVELVLALNPAAGETRTDVTRVWSGDGKERVLAVDESVVKVSE